MCKETDALKNLTHSEINSLIEDYKNKKMSIQTIIDKYDLNIAPAKLNKLLPPVETEEICPFCNENMFKRLRRTSPSTGRKQIFCETCGHVIYIGGYGKKLCKCENCEKARVEAEEEKRLKIIETIKMEQSNFSKYEISEISLEDHLCIYRIISETPVIDINEGIIGTIPLLKMHEEYIDLEQVCALTNKSILLLSEKTPVTAFTSEPPYKYKMSEVYYILNITDAPNIIKSIKNCSYFKNYFSIEENIGFLKYLIHEDLILNMHKKMNKRNLNLYVSATASENLYNLLDTLSYAQLDYLCYKAATFYSDKVITKSMRKDVAERMALSTIYSYYEKAQENGWTIHKSKMFGLGEQLRTFVEDNLGKNIEILNYVPTKELLMSEEFDLNVNFRKNL